MSDEVLDVIAPIFFWAYGVILAAGTVMTLIFLLALMRGRKMLAQWPFYTIVWSMTWMDAIYLTAQLVWQFPQMASEGEEHHEHEMIEGSYDAWYELPAFHFLLDCVNLIPTKGILYFSLLMALNRLAVFVRSPLTPLFSKEYVGWTNLGCWTLSVYTESLTPRYGFNRTSLEYEILGPALIDSPPLIKINNISDYMVPFVIIVIYSVVFFEIRKKSSLLVVSTTSSSISSSSVRSRPPDDRKLLFQAIVITFFLQLDNATRVVNVLYEGDGWHDYFINMIDLITVVLNHSIHATIFLVSNPTIRGFLPHIRIRENFQRARCF